LLYESESWSITARDINRIQAVEIKYLRIINGSTRLDNIKNEDTRKMLKIQTLDEHTKNWINHLGRMTDEKTSKQILRYKSKGC
jgi:hypothetical protein